MTAIHHPLHMYADSAVFFKDLFASNDDLQRPGWYSHPQQLDINQPLTPPPEMTGFTHASKTSHHQPENGHRYSDYRAPTTSFVKQEASDADVKPKMTHDDFPEQSQQRRSSQANAIAPSFQIPKSVNDSGGSLSELAAQITCLFWFESSDLLQQIEDCVTQLHPTRQLVTDARPTAGFRKWVTTILSTTLVAQNVVLLALLFIYRLKKLNPTVNGKPGSEYRLLTVALMLGNKFLDDNTYTNKTWAEVSGINVSEVHVMEVEFLSNMKYCLYTSADDWTQWQSLLGKFAAYLERASRRVPAPILPPASSLHLPMALPSPPASNQASPPYVADLGPGGSAYLGPTPAPSPLAVMSYENMTGQSTRKRSNDDYSSEPPPKRQANSQQAYPAPLQFPNSSMNPGQPASRLTLPSLSVHTGMPSSNFGLNMSQTAQLPPLNVPSRAMAMVYPNASSHVQLPQISALAGPSSQPQSQVHSQYQSRQHSPFPVSAGASPTSGIPDLAALRHSGVQGSPSFFLQQRNSPYRPVHNVSTLLYPPPSGALHHRPQNIAYDQMHYQPLGKPLQQQQAGQLPYITQNVYLEGNHYEAMTPVHRWPGMNLQQLIPQQ